MTQMNKCEHAEQLISYFYGEASADERRSFEQHLSACPVCREELASFGEVRTAVRAWHTEVLEHAPTLTINALRPQASERNGHAGAASFVNTAAPRTALAALREFFSLTPAWARFGMVAASLVVCALAVLAVTKAQFSWNDKGIAFGSGWNKQMTHPQEVAAPAPVQVATSVTGATLTPTDIAKLIAERDAAQRDLAATRKQLDAAQQQVSLLNASLANSQATYRQTLAALRTTRNVQANGRSRGRFGGAQLASNPNSIEADDEGLRLSDLLTEVSAGREQPQVKRDER